MAHIDTTPTGEIERGARVGEPMLQELRDKVYEDVELRKIQNELEKDSGVSAMRSTSLLD